MKNIIRWRWALGLLAALAAQASTMAADTLQLTNEVFQEIELTGPDGKTERLSVPAVKVLPGTEVLYVITYRNMGVQAADDIVITNPIARELSYTGDSASGTAETSDVSVDGGKTYGPLANLQVVGTDGKRRPAQADDVTHVRWRLGRSVQPGEEGQVSFRAVLR